MSENKVLNRIETDFEVLKNAFGEGYFILMRFKKPVLLGQHQKEELLCLVEERNHFEILCFENAIRSESSGFSVS